jgi:membrane glycosyltransferase
MHKREFQNMFMFSPGFMGASLKWNCKDQDDDSATFSASTTNFSMTIPETTGVMTSPASMNGKKQMVSSIAQLLYQTNMSPSFARLGLQSSALVWRLWKRWM